MTSFTVACEASDLDAQRAAVDAFARDRGGTAAWRSHARSHRAYGLLEFPGEASPSELRALVADVTVYETAIIVLAVFPSVPEALPPLYRALCGPGGPQGMVACESLEGGAILAWDPQRSPVAIVLDTIAVALRRFGSARTCELLAPLPLELLAAIAAQGLATPDIGVDRVLERLIAAHS